MRVSIGFIVKGDCDNDTTEEITKLYCTMWRAVLISLLSVSGGSDSDDATASLSEIGWVYDILFMARVFSAVPAGQAAVWKVRSEDEHMLESMEHEDSFVPKTVEDADPMDHVYADCMACDMDVAAVKSRPRHQTSPSRGISAITLQCSL